MTAEKTGAEGERACLEVRELGSGTHSRPQGRKEMGKVRERMGRQAARWLEQSAGAGGMREQG